MAFVHVSLTVNWCAHIARRKRTHGAKRSINLLQKDTKYIFHPVVVLWSVDLLSDHWSKSKILSTGVRYEGISYSPQKHISQLSDYREWENDRYFLAHKQHYRWYLLLKPMSGRLGLPGNAIESTAATTIAANGGLWTLGFKDGYFLAHKQHSRWYLLLRMMDTSWHITTLWLIFGHIAEYSTICVIIYTCTFKFTQILDRAQ